MIELFLLENLDNKFYDSRTILGHREIKTCYIKLMKKLLIFIVVNLLWCNVTFASCYNDLNNNYKDANKEAAYFTYDKGYERRLDYVFRFENPTNKTIEVNRIVVKAKDGNTIYSANHDLIIDPYTKGKTIGVKLRNDFTKEVVEGLYYSCRYVKAGTKSKMAIKPKSKKSDSWFKWWYLLFILPALGVLNGFIEEFKNKSNNKKTKSSIKKIKSSEKVHPGNIIEDIWDGKKSLGETYWLYFILINGIISFGSAYFAELNSNNFYFIPGLASNVITMVGVWNSSTLYQLKKIEEKQPYGWAYAAKVSVVLNGLSIAATAVQVFNL